MRQCQQQPQQVQVQNNIFVISKKCSLNKRVVEVSRYIFLFCFYNQIARVQCTFFFTKQHFSAHTNTMISQPHGRDFVFELLKVYFFFFSWVRAINAVPVNILFRFHYFNFWIIFFNVFCFFFVFFFCFFFVLKMF